MKRILITIFAGLTALGLDAQVPNYVPSNGLVGYWPFNGNANDESGNGNNGTVNGATLTSDRFGYPNKAYNFNSNYIYIPFNTTFNTANITVSAWVNPINYGNPGQGAAIVHRYQYGYSNPSGETFRFMLSQDNLGYIKPELSDISQSTLLNSPTILPLNTWSFASFTFDGTSLKTYVNGLLVATTTNSTFQLNTNGNSGLSIGISDQANGLFYAFFGNIDDIGIWNRALTQQEITTLYQGCTNAILTQPVNQNVLAGNNAQFGVVVSSGTASYQWQQNSGTGYTNLSDFGQYSGVTTNTLTVSNVNSSQNNYGYRCIINDGGCLDTTTIALLTVNNNVGMNEASIPTFSIYPNPANDIITISLNKPVNNVAIEVYDICGKLIISEVNKLGKNFDLNTSNLAAGAYCVKLTIEGNQSRAIFIKK